MDADPAATPPAKTSAKSSVRFVVAVPLLFAPAVVLAFTPLAAATELVFVGLIPTLLGLLYGRRRALVIAVVTAAFVGLVELANPSPTAAVAIMVAVGLAVGASALRGWQNIATVIATWPAVLLVGPPLVIPALQQAASVTTTSAAAAASPAAAAPLAWLAAWPAVALLAALVTLAGGLFTVLIGRLLLPDLPRSTLAPVDRLSALVYGAALAIVLGIATFAVTTWAPDTTAGWALLTILVVARPGFSATWHRIVTRSLGTIAGGLAAAILSLLIPLGAVLLAIGILALVAAIVLQLKKSNYAVYSFALTAAVVLLNSHGTDVVGIDLQRVLFTVAGAVLTAAAVTALQIILSRRAERSSASHPSE